MPYKKKYRCKRRPRRAYKKKTALTPSPSYPIGKTFKFKTRYVEPDGALTPAVSPVSAIYSLNGMYDVNISAVGHQPLGFDQLMPLYDHYTVIGARCKVTLSNTSPDQNVLAVLQVKDNSTASNLMQEVMENGNNKYVMLTPTSGGKSNQTLTVGVSMSKFLGRKVMQEDTCRGGITANPFEGVFAHLHLQTPSGAAALVTYVMEIDYVAVLTEPKQLLGS